MQKETITLSHHDGTWYAKSDSLKVVELFGTDTLPTAYTTQLDAITVAERIQASKAAQGVEATVLFDFIL